MTQILPDPADRSRPKVLYPQPFTGMALALRPQPPGARPHVRLITNDNQRTVQPPVPHDVAVGADIHLWVERRSDAGEWMAVTPDGAPLQSWHDPTRSSWYRTAMAGNPVSAACSAAFEGGPWDIHRDYFEYHLLGGTGRTSEHVGDTPPIVPIRDWPEDASADASSVAPEYGRDGVFP